MESVSEPATDLLYFFITGNSLAELYKKLFIDNGNNSVGQITPNDIKVLKDFTSSQQLFFEMNIRVENGRLTTFSTQINRDKQYLNSYNEIGKNTNISDLFTYGEMHNRTNLYNLYFVKCNETINMNEEQLSLIQKTLKLPDTLSCNVRCKFFNCDRQIPIEKDLSDDSIYKSYYDICKNDISKIKKIFIADDAINDSTNLLQYIISKQNPPPEIILLPCLHATKNHNDCKYDKYSEISTNCKQIGHTQIDTTVYTDFYGEDVVRKSSLSNYLNLPTKSIRSHCRDTNFISIVLNKYYANPNAGGKRRTNKKSKKTKKTKKTRKHKKTRKN
jgi:hypothetical protein